MNCPKCNAPIGDGDMFCTNCGCNVAQYAPQPVQPVEQPAPRPVEQLVPQPVEQLAPQPNEQPIPQPVEQPAYQAPQPQYGAPVVPNTAPVQPQMPPQAPVPPAQPINPPAPAPQNPPKQKAPGSNKKLGVILGVVGAAVLVIVILVVGALVLKSHYSPKNTVNKLAAAMAEGNWEEVYDRIGFEDSKLVNKQGFVNMCQKDRNAFGVDLSNVSGYDVSCYNGINGAVEGTIIFHHNGASDERLNVKLTLENDGFMFMDTYKLELENSPLVDYTVYAPKGGTVTINGVSLDYVTADDEYESHYYVDEILPGEYDIKVTHNNCEEFADTITVYSTAELEEMDNEAADYDYCGEYNYGYYDSELGKVVNGAYGNTYFACLDFTNDYKNELKSNIDAMSREIFEQIVNDTFNSSDYDFVDEESIEFSEENVREYSEEYIYQDFTDIGFTNEKPVIDSYSNNNEKTSDLYMPCSGYLYYAAYYDTDVYSVSTYVDTNESGKDWYFTEFNVDYHIEADGKLLISGIYFTTETDYY